MKHPNDQQIDMLLRAQLRAPSARFERLLATVPQRERQRRRRALWDSLKSISVAAAILLSISFFARDALQLGTPPPPTQPLPYIATLDADLVELLTMAGPLAAAAHLLQPELREAVDFYAFNQ